MKKNRNFISINLVPQSIGWKLGSFISLLLLLFPALLSASDNSSVESSTNSGPPIKIELKEDYISSAIHIAEGTTVYGIENISQKPQDKIISEKAFSKTHKKVTKHTTAKKNPEKVSAPQENKLPEINIRISSGKSEDDFDLSDRHVGAVTAPVNPVTSAVLLDVLHLREVILLNTNSSYIPYLLLKGGWADSVFFTRPPPFI